MPNTVGSTFLSQMSAISTLVETGLGFESIRNCLFHSSQVWTIDELGMRDIWYIGVQCHTNRGFRAALTNYLSGFQSSSFPTSIDNPALSVFNMERIVHEVKEADKVDRAEFLMALIAYGTLEMVLPFLAIGIDRDEHPIWPNYLGRAASQGKVALVESLLNAGASATFAVHSICEADKLNDSDFETVFLKLMDSIRQNHNMFAPFPSESPDPLVAILRCSRALRASPESIGMLFSRGIFNHQSLYGSEKCFLIQSHIFSSILYDRPSALKLFVSHGVPLDSRVGSIFVGDLDHIGPLADYTWLTLAIELGRSACVCVLVGSASGFWDAGEQHEGQNYALQFSKSLAAGAHPRIPGLWALGQPWYIGKDAPQDPVSVEEDETIYKVLQTAFGFDCDRSEIASPEQAQVAVVSHDEVPRASSDEAQMSLEELCYVAVSFLGIYTIIFGYMVLNVATSLLARGQLFGRRGVLSSAALVFLAWMLYHVF